MSRQQEKIDSLRATLRAALDDLPMHVPEYARAFVLGMELLKELDALEKLGAL